jgi:hypothetical protein
LKNELKRISLAMTDETHRQLRTIAAHADLSQPEMLALLIERAYQDFRRQLVEETKAEESTRAGGIEEANPEEPHQETEAPVKPKPKRAPGGKQLTIPATRGKRPQ